MVIHNDDDDGDGGGDDDDDGGGDDILSLIYHYGSFCLFLRVFFTEKNSLTIQLI